MRAWSMVIGDRKILMVRSSQKWEIEEVVCVVVDYQRRTISQELTRKRMMKHS